MTPNPPASELQNYLSFLRWSSGLSEAEKTTPKKHHKPLEVRGRCGAWVRGLAAILPLVVSVRKMSSALLPIVKNPTSTAACQTGNGQDAIPMGTGEWG